MAGKRRPQQPVTPDRVDEAQILRDQIAALQNAIATKDRVTAAQQDELQQLREMARDLTFQKRRAFRARRIPLDRLDITIKGTDITEDEVVLEQGRGYVTIRVGDAVGVVDGIPRREAFRFTADESYAPIAPAAIPPPQAVRGANDIRTTARDVYDASLSASNAFQDGDPSVINASLAPQADPRIPSVAQLEPDFGVAQHYGWIGAGPKPRGWHDPDAKPAEPTH